jgi:hypothetical protein
LGCHPMFHPQELPRDQQVFSPGTGRGGENGFFFPVVPRVPGLFHSGKARFPYPLVDQALSPWQGPACPLFVSRAVYRHGSSEGGSPVRPSGQQGVTPAPGQRSPDSPARPVGIPETGFDLRDSPARVSGKWKTVFDLRDSPAWALAKEHWVPMAEPGCRDSPDFAEALGNFPSLPAVRKRMRESLVPEPVVFHFPFRVWYHHRTGLYPGDERSPQSSQTHPGRLLWSEREFRAGPAPQDFSLRGPCRGPDKKGTGLQRFPFHRRKD